VLVVGEVHRLDTQHTLDAIERDGQLVNRPPGGYIPDCRNEADLKV